MHLSYFLKNPNIHLFSHLLSIQVMAINSQFSSVLTLIWKSTLKVFLGKRVSSWKLRACFSLFSTLDSKSQAESKVKKCRSQNMRHRKCHPQRRKKSMALTLQQRQNPHRPLTTKISLKNSLGSEESVKLNMSPQAVPQGLLCACTIFLMH